MGVFPCGGYIMLNLNHGEINCLPYKIKFWSIISISPKDEVYLSFFMFILHPK